MPSIDGAAGRGTTSSGSAGDGIEGHDERPAFLRRRWTGTASLGSRKNEQESTGGQGPKAEYSYSREPHEGTHSIRLKRENHMQQSTPVGSDYLEFGKHGAKTYQEVLKLDPEYCRWTDHVEDQQSHWKLQRFSSWLTMQRVLQEPNLENNMTQERLTRRIKQLEAENLFDNSTGEEKSGAEGASSGIDGTSPVVDEAFASVWRGEIGKEFCGMADARRKNTMSTVRSDEMAWAEEQARHSPKVPH